MSARQAQQVCSNHLSYDVVVTARSAEKGKRVVQGVNPDLQHMVTFAVVGNVADEGAFDEVNRLSCHRNHCLPWQVMKSEPFDFIVHTASPYQLHFDDPVRDCLDPAIKGTTGILKSAKAYAPTVKRVVITSSSAAVLNPPNHRKVYSETSWSEVTWEQAMDPMHTYRASKVSSPPSLSSPAKLSQQKFAEKAAWDFIASEKPNFDLATINNTYTFGPVPNSLDSLDNLNTSNHRIRDLVLGHMRNGVQPTAPVFTFVDVRDVALAHVRALSVPEAGGSRFYLVGGFFSNPRVAQIIRKNFPQLEDKLPPFDTKDDFPDDHWQFDTTKSKKVLGLEYVGLEKSVVDTVQSMLGRKEWGILKV